MAKRQQPASASKSAETPKAAKSPSRKTKTRRKRRARIREEISSYLMRGAGWDYYYSFRVSDPKSRWDPGPYRELATLSFTGKVIRPEDS